jgi:hypothetical protein
LKVLILGKSVKTLPIILQWLSWKPGNGFQIEVGRDVMLGLGKLALLSTNLLEHLHRKNIFFLFQFKIGSKRGSFKRLLAQE